MVKGKREPEIGDTWTFGTNELFEFVGYATGGVERDYVSQLPHSGFYVFKSKDVDSSFWVVTPESFNRNEHKEFIPKPEPEEVCICYHSKKAHGWSDTSCFYSYNCNCKKFRLREEDDDD